MGDTTDAAELTRDLNQALPLMARDALACALTAGALSGPEGLVLADRLREFAADELEDLERIAARIATLGGTPSAAVESFDADADWRSALAALLKMKRETLDALVAAIPADADDAEGEASEHLLEHIVARKRDVIEILERATR